MTSRGSSAASPARGELLDPGVATHATGRNALVFRFDIDAATPQGNGRDRPGAAFTIDRMSEPRRPLPGPGPPPPAPYPPPPAYVKLFVWPGTALPGIAIDLLPISAGVSRGWAGPTWIGAGASFPQEIFAACADVPSVVYRPLPPREFSPSRPRGVRGGPVGAARREPVRAA